MKIAIMIQPSSSISFDNDTGTDEPYGPGLIAVNSVITSLALIGNGLVITVMLARRRVFSSFTNRLILHQSVIDSIAAVLFFLHKVVKSPGLTVSDANTFLDQFVCRFLFPDILMWCVYVTSTYNLVIISLERFMATCYPLKHRKVISKGKLKFAVAATWVIGFVHGINLINLFEPHQGKCQLVSKTSGLALSQGMLNTLIRYTVPLIILIYAYTRILIRLHKKIVNPANIHQNFFRRAKENVLKTVLVAGIMFAICWFPIEYVYFRAILGHVPSMLVYRGVTALVSCNAAVNPVIYCFMYEHFRSQLKDVFRKRLRRNQVQNGQPIRLGILGAA
ncbi:allatostatin-A receptor-like [Patiria miniata]|uniref:G-protein coupled receptors family 1 profile domain-containing protein n=1 Tax=Patiria miniata TaxID=46514 RepID=A0A914A433_PATMI|nr:allatostatin-A receptor-like [Patiria miniata]